MKMIKNYKNSNSPKAPKFIEPDPFTELLSSMNPKNPANIQNSRMALKLSRLKQRNKALK